MTKNSTSKLRFTLRTAALALMAAMVLAVTGASPALADRCDDIAAQLGGAIDGVKVGFRAENNIYLSHPLAKEMSVGCAGRNFQIELYVKAGDRTPKPGFIEFVGSAAAIVFTLPKDDALTGVSRCMTRMGLFRGDNIKMRYRRLDFSCSRNKTEAWIAITRGADE
jgi:hypothetical protein